MKSTSIYMYFQCIDLVVSVVNLTFQQKSIVILIKLDSGQQRKTRHMFHFIRGSSARFEWVSVFMFTRMKRKLLHSIFSLDINTEMLVHLAEIFQVKQSLHQNWYIYSQSFIVFIMTRYFNSLIDIINLIRCILIVKSFTLNYECHRGTNDSIIDQHLLDILNNSQILLHIR